MRISIAAGIAAAAVALAAPAAAQAHTYRCPEKSYNAQLLATHVTTNQRGGCETADLFVSNVQYDVLELGNNVGHRFQWQDAHGPVKATLEYRSAYTNRAGDPVTLVIAHWDRVVVTYETDQ